MRARGTALVLAALVGLAGCSPSPADPAGEFSSWASAQQNVVSVSGTHLVVDGAISDDDLVALSASARAEADSLGAGAPNLIVGNAWAFSADPDGANAATVVALRDDPVFVGATVEYEPLEPTDDYAGGIRGSVTTQAALRDAYDALVDAAGDVEGLPVTAATADGAFGISGTGTGQPLEALGLWQEISGRMLVAGAWASTDPERLEITVGTAEERAVAESIAAEHPGVALTVHQ